MNTLRVRLICVCLLLGCLIVPAGAGDLSRKTIPSKWLERILPEPLPALHIPRYYIDLEKARAQVFHGRYRLGLITLRKVTQADPAEVAVVRATALWATGRYDEALSALTAEAVIDHPEAQVLRAQILADTGQIDQAISLLRRHVQQHPESIPGHYYLGAFHEMKGDLQAAEAAYAWFDADERKLMDRWLGQGAEGFDSNPRDIVLMGRAYDRLSLLQRRYTGPDGQPNTRLHDEILNIFVSVYDTLDPEYWPAHLAAAEYYRSHDMMRHAVDELKAAAHPQTGNPNDREVLRLAGLLSLDQYNFDQADDVIAAMRQVDRTSLIADVLEARTYLTQRRPRDAERVLDRVLNAQPNNLEALGLLAAGQMLQLRDDEARQTLQRVEQIDPDNATAYLEVASALSAMRQYPRAIAHYQVALERAPWWPEVYNGLGLLYTQSGDEDAARRVLTQANLLDPFNERTLNYIKLLDSMDRLDRRETEHFIVLYDAQRDPLAGELIGDYMERIYPEVVAAFGVEPKEKTLIEVFPTHDAFSVRTTGSPWIGTVGACTGRVIAMVAPRKAPGTMGNYNWAQVLRHEFTHTVTLAATENRIAHWMTEGLAVQEERTPVRWEWVPMLYHAVTNRELFDMEHLTWAFWRPRRPIDRQLAYAQSWWVCEYIEQTWGRDALLKMMNQFRDGATEEQAFAAVLGISTSQFTQDFFRWAEQRVASWGYDPQTTEKYNELRQRGEALIAARQYAEAIPVWQEIARLRPVDELPQQRLAGLYLHRQVNQREKAIEHLINLHKVSLKNNMYAKRIALLYRDLGQLDQAAYYASEAVHVDPYDVRAHEILAEILEKAGDQDGAARLKRMVAMVRKLADEAEKNLQSPRGALEQ